MATQPRDDSWDTVKSFIAGGISGAAAKTLIAPLDRMKILFQISNMKFSARAVVEELSRTVREEGLRALFRGNGAQILRVYPYSGIQLMSFDRYSSMLKASGLIHTKDGYSQSRRLTGLEKLLAGAGAGATSVLATYPLDLMRARLAVQQELPGLHPTHKHVGLVRAVRTIYHEYGLTNFYRGVSPTLLGILPYAGISFTTFETLKQIYQDEFGHEPTPGARLLCGGVAGVTGQAVTYPLDIARRRMQTEGFTPMHAHALDAGVLDLRGDAGGNRSRSSVSSCSDASSGGAGGLKGGETGAKGGAASCGASHPTPGAAIPPHSPHSTPHHHLHAVRQAGMVETLTRVVTKEGWRGLFKGMSMNLIKGPIAIGVSFTTYDLLKKAWHIEKVKGGE